MAMDSAEDVLKNDNSTLQKKRDVLQKMEHEKFLYGGGKSSSGVLGLGHSDEEMASQKKEVDDWKNMQDQQFLLRKQNEANDRVAFENNKYGK